MWNSIIKIGEQVSNQITKVQTEFDQSHRAYLVQRKQNDGGEFLEEPDLLIAAARETSDNKILPWDGYSNAVKEEILDLSSQERNFLVDPPEDTQFVYDEQTYAQQAINVLNIDKRLGKLRFKLVPSKLKDNIFWRNYFYRVNMIKDKAMLENPLEQNIATKQETPITNNSDVLFEAEEDEFEYDENWEQELQEELQQ